LLVPVPLPEVSVVPVDEVPLPLLVPLLVPLEFELPQVFWPLELVPELLPVPSIEPLLVVPDDELPLLLDIGEVLSAALLVLPVPVELQAARLMAIRAPIITPW
jgi:hypothetical protein